MDAHMPRMNGIEATKVIRRDFPHVTVFGFTASGPEMAGDLMKAGAVAVFEKTSFADVVRSLRELTG